MKQNKNILGIHIDDDSLNIVHLRHGANGLGIHKWTSEHLAAGVIENGLIVDEKTVLQKIRAFTKANRLKSCKVIISTSCSSVRLRPCEFPEMTDEKLKKQVEEQVGKYSLFDSQSAVFDYCTFKEPAAASNKQTVLLAVTARQISDACMSIAEKAGLKLERIEPAIISIIKLVLNKPASSSKTVSLLLALDSASGNLSVFKNGIPRLCQNLSLGIKDILEGKDGFARLAESMKPVLEFARSIADSQQLVLKIAGACNAAKLETITGKIKQSLSDVTIEQMDCSQIAKEFDLQDTDAGDIPIFAFASALTAFGVCQFDGQLNLTSKESLTIQKTKKEMSLTAKAVAAVVVLSVAVLVPLKMKIKSAEAASAQVEAKVAETIPMRDKINGLREQISLHRGKLPTYDTLDKKLVAIPWPKVMQAIGNALSGKVRIDEITTTNSGEFTLRGQALGEGHVHKFAKELQNSKLLESVKVEKIEYPDKRNVSLIRYKITCKIQMPENEL
ncbi:MAG: pilus assembly protein PilM [Planctomycetes bacterium]|nr:pilus assembly protein PilM [Planctomycetota bacterium]